MNFSFAQGIVLVMLKAVLFIFLLSATARAETFLDRLVSDPDPTAFAPEPFTTDDFEIVAEGNVHAHLVHDSLQWVRVDETLVAPRALLEIQIPGSGVITSGSISQPISQNAQVLVALVSGNTIGVSAPQGKAKISIFFRPKEKKERIFFDASCSRVGLNVKATGLSENSWLYIGCKPVRDQEGSLLHRDLDLQVFTDSTNGFSLNGVEVAPTEAHRFQFRLTHSSSKISLQSHPGTMELEANIPKVAHSAFLGAGLGPYVFQFDKGATHYRSTVPMATLYGSYSLHGTNRIVLFAAITGNEHAYSDAGAYFQFESLRFFDRRLSFQLLIGGHGYSYQSPEAHLSRFNFPQGFEIFYFDLLRRGYNGSLGGFLQPAINGKEYYNTWLRWGPASWFLEMNFIYAAEQPEFVIRTYGLTVGFPIANFL